MPKPALVVLAAGMGSRYGGLKQVDPVGPNGELMIDYSIYDALRTGFEKIVFVIKEEIEEIFKERIGRRMGNIIDVEYVFQKIEDLPEGYDVPAGRVKPWGTAHAVLSCRNAVNTPFSVVNADDFYGPSSFKVVCNFFSNLADSKKSNHYAMVGFILENTLTENGTVARGVCSVDERGYLSGIKERTRIGKFKETAKFTEDGESWSELPEGSTVSMNMWGFTPSIFRELEQRFPKFLDENRANLLKAEYFLPEMIGSLLVEGNTAVKVLRTNEKWYGVTYKEDKPLVKKAIDDLIKQGVYPGKLWG